MASYLTSAASISEDSLSSLKAYAGNQRVFAEEVSRALDEFEEEEHARFLDDVRAGKVGGRHDATLSSRMRLSAFAQKYICYDEGHRISFKRRPWMPQIYDSEFQRRDKQYPRRRVLLKTARQCEKSTQIGNKLLGNTALTSNMTALYVSSGTINTGEFVDERIENTIRISPRLQAVIGKRALIDNKMTKRFLNNSRCLFRSAHLNANRVRGIPADLVAIDEIQDFIKDTIPVITAATKNSNLPLGPIWLFSGTPLSTENPIEQTWAKNSTQNVWLTRCTRCRTWNPPGPAQVTRHGMCCEKCGNALNPLAGQWVRMKESGDPTFEGYHLSQAMMPYTVIDNEEMFQIRWRNFYSDVHDQTVSEAQIKNELFGLSHDSGKKPITQEQLMRCSDDPTLSMSEMLPDRVRLDPTFPKFAGIDFGEGSGDGAYTVIHLGYMNGDKMEVCFAKRYIGPEAEPGFVKRHLAQLIEGNNITLCICDAGHGWGMIDAIRENVSNGMNRVIPMEYNGMQANAMQWNGKKGMFQAHRTRWMSKIFSLLIRGDIRLPRWVEYQEPFGEDILNIFADRSPKLRQMIYNHTATDDSFHSLLYMQTAKMYYYQEIDDFLNA